MTLSIRTQQETGRQGQAGVGIQPCHGGQSLAGAQGPHRLFVTLSTVPLDVAMASVYTAASSWISLWF